MPQVTAPEASGLLDLARELFRSTRIESNAAGGFNHHLETARSARRAEQKSPAPSGSNTAPDDRASEDDSEHQEQSADVTDARVAGTLDAPVATQNCTITVTTAEHPGKFMIPGVPPAGDPSSRAPLAVVGGESKPQPVVASATAAARLATVNPEIQNAKTLGQVLPVESPVVAPDGVESLQPKSESSSVPSTATMEPDVAANQVAQPADFSNSATNSNAESVTQAAPQPARPALDKKQSAPRDDKLTPDRMGTLDRTKNDPVRAAIQSVERHAALREGRSQSGALSGSDSPDPRLASTADSLETASSAIGTAAVKGRRIADGVRIDSAARQIKQNDDSIVRTTGATARSSADPAPTGPATDLAAFLVNVEVSANGKHSSIVAPRDPTTRLDGPLILTLGSQPTDASPQARAALDRAVRVMGTSGGEGPWRVSLRLDPPELGVLHLDARLNDGALTLNVRTDTDAVKRMVESRMSELRDALHEHGIRFDRAEVVVRGGAESGSSQSRDSSNAHAGRDNPADSGLARQSPNDGGTQQSHGRQRHDQPNDRPDSLKINTELHPNLTAARIAPDGRMDLVA